MGRPDTAQLKSPGKRERGGAGAEAARAGGEGTAARRQWTVGTCSDTNRRSTRRPGSPRPLPACVLSHSSSVRLCDPVDCSPPGSSVHGILQARILEWVAMPSSRGSSPPRDRTHVSYVSCIGRQVLYHQRHLGTCPNLLKKKKNDKRGSAGSPQYRVHSAAQFLGLSRSGDLDSLPGAGAGVLGGRTQPCDKCVWW